MSECMNEFNVCMYSMYVYRDISLIVYIPIYAHACAILKTPELRTLVKTSKL